MPKYYVNNKPQTNGDHEVHEDGCYYLPLILDKKDLGYHDNCKSAVKKAKEDFYQVNGCYYCSNECHTA